MSDCSTWHLYNFGAKLEEKKKGVMGCPQKKKITKRSLSQVCNHGKGVSFIARPRAYAQCAVSLIFTNMCPCINLSVSAFGFSSTVKL